MSKYRDHNRDCPHTTGVDHYFIGYQKITLQFKVGGSFEYTERNVGRKNVNEMKRMAQEGDCLNTWLDQNPAVKSAGNPI